MEKLDRITVDPNVCLGQPTIRGMRITVSVILKMLAAGKCTQEILEAYPELEPADVEQAIKYGAWMVSDQIRMVGSPPETESFILRFLADMNLSPKTVAALRTRAWDIFRVPISCLSQLPMARFSRLPGESKGF